jgi:hypothetical protein
MRREGVTVNGQCPAAADSAEYHPGSGAVLCREAESAAVLQKATLHGGFDGTSGQILRTELAVRGIFKQHSPRALHR